MLTWKPTILILMVATGFAAADSSRTIHRIPSRTTATTDAAPTTTIKPLSRKIIEKALLEIIAAWNTPRLDQYLSPDFYDKSRLLDAVNGQAPRDAKLRLLAVQSLEIMRQRVTPIPDQDLVVQLVTTARVVAQTQLEFNDPARGFQRLAGVNEFILQLVTIAPR